MEMTKAESAIRVDHVRKSFRIYSERNFTLKDRLMYAGRAKHREFVALNDVSLDIRRGATIGLLGVNGSGKSTLLKLMSRILYPDSGTVTINGRVSSLLELGAGFHPDFTGRENIYMNGALFGLSKKEMNQKIDEIIEFSELKDFVDQPVRSYSSGMYMRLAFSVAVAVDPEILLIDEILAVGDAPFQQKCMSRIRQLKAKNRTIVMVTHDMGAVKQFCDGAVWLHHGRIKMEGEPTECIQSYLELAFAESESHLVVNSVRDDSADQSLELENPLTAKHWGNGQAKITNVKVVSRHGNAIVNCGDALDVHFKVFAQNALDNVSFVWSIFNESGALCFSTNTAAERVGNFAIAAGENSVILHIPNFSLMAGSYSMDLGIHSERGKPFDYYKNCCAVTVVSDIEDQGIYRVPHSWRIENE